METLVVVVLGVFLNGDDARFDGIPDLRSVAAGELPVTVLGLFLQAVSVRL